MQGVNAKTQQLQVWGKNVYTAKDHDVYSMERLQCHCDCNISLVDMCPVYLLVALGIDFVENIYLIQV